MPDQYLRWNELDENLHHEIKQYYIDRYGISADIVFDHKAALYDRIAIQVRKFIEAIGCKVAE